MDADMVARFWEQVDQGAPDACWEWSGRRFSTGYGRIAGHRTAYAHRKAYELTHGTIPAGMHICHSCDNPPCCNPAHLWLGTPKDNMHDRDRKGRGNKGKTIASGKRRPYRRVPGGTPRGRKLTEVQVRDIRASFAEGARQTDLGRKYGVDRTTIRDIVNGKKWRIIE